MSLEKKIIEEKILLLDQISNYNKLIDILRTYLKKEKVRTRDRSLQNYLSKHNKEGSVLEVHKQGGKCSLKKIYDYDFKKGKTHLKKIKEKSMCTIID